MSGTQTCAKSVYFRFDEFYFFTVKCVSECFLKNEWRLLIVYFLRAASYSCFLRDVIPPRAVCVAFFPSPPLQYFRFFSLFHFLRVTRPAPLRSPPPREPEGLDSAPAPRLSESEI